MILYPCQNLYLMRAGRIKEPVRQATNGTAWETNGTALETNGKVGGLFLSPLSNLYHTSRLGLKRLTSHKHFPTLLLPITASTDQAASQGRCFKATMEAAPMYSHFLERGQWKMKTVKEQTKLQLKR